MSLQIYDTTLTTFGNTPLRTFHNGHIGDSHEQLVYIRNQNSAKWYTSVKLTPAMIGGYNDTGEFGTTGWGIKLMYGKRRPTEEEWDLLKSGSSILLPDIGTVEAADTFTNHPVWVRIYCPGGEEAQIRENMQLKLTYLIKEVDE